MTFRPLIKSGRIMHMIGDWPFKAEWISPVQSIYFFESKAIFCFPVIDLWPNYQSDEHPYGLLRTEAESHGLSDC
jgi:hypothetical protein